MHHTWHGEEPLEPLAAPLPHPPTELPVLPQAAQGSNDRLRIAGRHDEAGDAVLDDLPVAPAVGADDRERAGHVLEEAVRAALGVHGVVGEQHADVGPPHQLERLETGVDDGQTPRAHERRRQTCQPLPGRHPRPHIRTARSCSSSEAARSLDAAMKDVKSFAGSMRPVMTAVNGRDSPP